MYIVSPKTTTRKITLKNTLKILKGSKYYTETYPLHTKEDNKGEIEEWKRHKSYKKLKTNTT